MVCNKSESEQSDQFKKQYEHELVNSSAVEDGGIKLRWLAF